QWICPACTTFITRRYSRRWRSKPRLNYDINAEWIRYTTTQAAEFSNPAHSIKPDAAGSSRHVCLRINQLQPATGSFACWCDGCWCECQWDAAGRGYCYVGTGHFKTRDALV